VHYSEKRKRISDLAEEYGESIDNLSVDVLMEAIYNEGHAFTANLLHDKQTEHQEKET
jgi:hypothetical protein